MKRLATATVAAVMAAAPVMADLVFPSLSYRTGAYAANGIPFADGYADYFTLLNERDGGIGGVMTRLVECETGSRAARGAARRRSRSRSVWSRRVRVASLEAFARATRARRQIGRAHV